MAHFAICLIGMLVCSSVCAEDAGYESRVLGIDAIDIADLDNPRAVKLEDGRTIGLPVTSGVLLVNVVDTGPASGKLDPWDILVKVGAEDVPDVATLRKLLSSAAKGKPVRLGIRRLKHFRFWATRVSGRYEEQTVEVTPVTRSELIRSRMRSAVAADTGVITCKHKDSAGNKGPTGIDISYSRGPDGLVTPAIKLRYRASERLDIERWVVLVDGVKHTIEADAKPIPHETLNQGSVGEWGDALLVDDLKKLAMALDVASEVEVTYQGRYGDKTIAISEENLMRVRESLDAARLDGWSP